MVVSEPIHELVTIDKKISGQGPLRHTVFVDNDPPEGCPTPATRAVRMKAA
jgi:hypothetical protein